MASGSGSRTKPWGTGQRHSTPTRATRTEAGNFCGGGPRWADPFAGYPPPPSPGGRIFRRRSPPRAARKEPARAPPQRWNGPLRSEGRPSDPSYFISSRSIPWCTGPLEAGPQRVGCPDAARCLDRTLEAVAGPRRGMARLARWISPLSHGRRERNPGPIPVLPRIVHRATASKRTSSLALSGPRGPRFVRRYLRSTTR